MFIDSLDFKLAWVTFLKYYSCYKKYLEQTNNVLIKILKQTETVKIIFEISKYLKKNTYLQKNGWLESESQGLI